MGFGVDEISEILPLFHDPSAMKKAMYRKRSELSAAIADRQNKLEKIAAMSGKLEKENYSMIYDVELKSFKSEKVLSLRETIPAEKEEELWGKLWTFIKENGVKHQSGGYSTYHDDEYEEDVDVDTEIAVPVFEFGQSRDGFVFKELPPIAAAATIRFSGSYENYGSAMEKLALWIEQNGYEIIGPVRGFAIASPTDVNSPDEYMTELQVPVGKV